MKLSTSLRRTAALAALTAVAASAALAGTASAATVEKARIIAPGAKIPVDFPGYREPANDRLPANHRILAVRVAVDRGERASTIVTVPKGFKLMTLGLRDGAQVGLSTENDYVGKRSVRLTLFVNPNLVAPGETGHGTIYALARRA